MTLSPTDTNGSGQAVIDHATTSGNGGYLFTETPGTYTVTVDASNFSFSGALRRYPASTTFPYTTLFRSSNANPSATSPTTLPGGTSDLSVDFGYYKNVTIGDFVWNDSIARAHV